MISLSRNIAALCTSVCGSVTSHLYNNNCETLLLVISFLVPNLVILVVLAVLAVLALHVCLQWGHVLKVFNLCKQLVNNLIILTITDDVYLQRLYYKLFKGENVQLVSSLVPNFSNVGNFGNKDDVFLYNR